MKCILAQPLLLPAYLLLLGTTPEPPLLPVAPHRAPQLLQATVQREAPLMTAAKAALGRDQLRQA